MWRGGVFWYGWEKKERGTEGTQVNEDLVVNEMGRQEHSA